MAEIINRTHLLSIDPGTRNLGLAFFEIIHYKDNTKKALLKCTYNVDVVQKTNASISQQLWAFRDMNLRMLCDRPVDTIIYEKQFCNNKSCNNYLNYLTELVCLTNYPAADICSITTQETDHNMKLFYNDCYKSKVRKERVNIFIALHCMLFVNHSQHEKDAIFQACMYFKNKGIFF